MDTNNLTKKRLFARALRSTSEYLSFRQILKQVCMASNLLLRPHGWYDLRAMTRASLTRASR